MRTFNLWFTGISGSGKSTLANELKKRLDRLGIKTQIIDGDETRKKIGGIFGHTKEERMKMFRVNIMLSEYLNMNDISTLTAVIAPFEEMRTILRETFGENYVEVYVKCSGAECGRRDVKGYYKLAADGIMQNLNGVNDVYEIPQNPDVIVDTEQEDVNTSAEKIMEYLRKNGYIG